MRFSGVVFLTIVGSANDPVMSPLMFGITNADAGDVQDVYPVALCTAFTVICLPKSADCSV